MIQTRYTSKKSDGDHMKRTIFLGYFAGALLAFGSSFVFADNYPSKPIKAIVPFAPGSATDQIGRAFAAKMAEGVHASDESVQELVKKHYEFILQFWTPNKEAYKSLAMTYILPSPYRDSYEEVAKGLGKYHYDAVCIWADKNL